MPKDFWIKCVKRFLLFSIPSLIAVITLFSYFSSPFENLLKNFGIFGAIIVCLLCFSLTLLYGIFEMEKVIYFVGSEYSNDPNFDTRVIYKSFRLSQDKRKIQENYSNVTARNSTDAVILSFSDKYLGMKEIFTDALQEITFIAMASGFTNISTIFNTRVIADIPQSLIEANILEVRKNINTRQKYNVIVEFYGTLNGSILLCFSQVVEDYFKNIIENKYPKYISQFSMLMESFLYELGSIFTGTCLSSFHRLDDQLRPLSWDEENYKVLNINIITNVNINYLKVHNNTENLYVIKMNGDVYEGNLFTSYIIFGKEDAERLVGNCQIQ